MPKTVHCIRHGQSTFNAHWEEGGSDPLHFDAPLSDLGQQQVAAAAVALRDVPYELVVTSPLTRAIQTTLGLFADHPSAPEIRVECLHRERLENSCDVGRSPVLLGATIPGLPLSISRRSGGTGTASRTGAASSSSPMRS